MNIPNKPTLLRTRNYFFECGHCMGVPIITHKQGKLCPFCVMKGKIILSYIKKYKKKVDKKRIKIFNDIFFQNTNTSSYKNIDKIIRNYL